MNNMMSSFYTFMSSTVMPTVAEQANNLVGGATQLAGGAAQVLTAVSQTALEWSSGSEDALGSAEVFSWEQQRGSSQNVDDKFEEKVDDKMEVKVEVKVDETPNTSIEWELVEENDELTGPVKHNQFEMVQNDYEWMKNSK